jgi:methanogenic corrinoid protein MtbC1
MTAQSAQRVSLAAEPPDEGCRHLISSVIETQIIPRLLQAHPSGAGRLAQETHQTIRIPESDVVEFANLCLLNDAILANSFADQLVRDGLSHETIFMQLITPAARYLGVAWETDTADFVQVTNGLMRMHEITHRIGFEYQAGPRKPGPRNRIMLACAPGSQHILGLTIVSEFFNKEGWQTVVEISSSAEGLIHAAANEWFDVIGISVAIESQLDGLETLVAGIRNASQNAKVAILLGGPIFTLRQFDATEFGACEICTDPKVAVKLALVIKSAAEQNTRP